MPMKIIRTDPFPLLHRRRADAQVDRHRWIVVAHRPITAQSPSLTQGRAAAQERPTLVERHCFRAKKGRCLGRLSARNGLLGDSSIESYGRLAKGLPLEETALGSAGSHQRIRPDRLAPCDGQFCMSSQSARGKKIGPSPVDWRKDGTKHYLLTEGGGILLVATITAANWHYLTQLLPLVDRVKPIRDKRGRPRQRPRSLYADWAYDSEPHLDALQQRGIKPHLARRRTEYGSGLGAVHYLAEQTQVLLHQFKPLWARCDIRDDIHESFV